MTWDHRSHDLDDNVQINVQIYTLLIYGSDQLSLNQWSRFSSQFQTLGVWNLKLNFLPYSNLPEVVIYRHLSCKSTTLASLGCLTFQTRSTVQRSLLDQWSRFPLGLWTYEISNLKPLFPNDFYPDSKIHWRVSFLIQRLRISSGIYPELTYFHHVFLNPMAVNIFGTLPGVHRFTPHIPYISWSRSYLGTSGLRTPAISILKLKNPLQLP